jgi:transposase
MPRPRVTMNKIREILRLLEEGLSQRQIATSLAIPRTTVGEYATRAKLASLSWPLPEDLDDDALQAKLFATPPPSGTVRPVPEWAVVHLELRRKGVTLMLLWHEYRETHPDGYAYTQFCEHYRRFSATLSPTMRLTHVMGEKMFIDFSGVTVPLWRNGAIVSHAEVFVSALGGSSLLYVEALASQELIHFIGAHTRAFEYYGGVPALLVPDNLKSGVTTPDRYEPLPNATYLEMASHYATAILPTRVETSRQGEGRSRRAGHRALDPRAATPRTLRIGRRSEPRSRAPARAGEQPTHARAERIATSNLRTPRTPGTASSPRRSLRVRHLAPGQGRH